MPKFKVTAVFEIEADNATEAALAAFLASEDATELGTTVEEVR